MPALIGASLMQVKHQGSIVFFVEKCLGNRGY